MVVVIAPKTVLLDMKNYLSKSDEIYDIIILFPNDYAVKAECEKEILNFKKFQIKYISTTLDKYEFESDSVLFFSLLGVKEFSLLEN